MCAVRVNLVDIWYRLKSRFDLEFYGLQPVVGFDESIQPVTVVDDLLVVQSLTSVAADIQAAAGSFVVFFTVPDDERWVVTGYSKEATTAVTRVGIRARGGGTVFSLFAEQAAARIEHSIRVKLDAGWQIGMFTTGNAGDASRSLALLREVEKVF